MKLDEQVLLIAPEGEVARTVMVLLVAPETEAAVARTAMVSLEAAVRDDDGRHASGQAAAVAGEARQRKETNADSGMLV